MLIIHKTNLAEANKQRDVESRKRRGIENGWPVDNGAIVSIARWAWTEWTSVWVTWTHGPTSSASWRPTTQLSWSPRNSTLPLTRRKSTRSVWVWIWQRRFFIFPFFLALSCDISLRRWVASWRRSSGVTQHNERCNKGFVFADAIISLARPLLARFASSLIPTCVWFQQQQQQEQQQQQQEQQQQPNDPEKQEMTAMSSCDVKNRKWKLNLIRDQSQTDVTGRWGRLALNGGLLAVDGFIVIVRAGGIEFHSPFKMTSQSSDGIAYWFRNSILMGWRD